MSLLKNTNWAEKIGFILIMIGFLFGVFGDMWQNNPIPNITEKFMLINSLGLLIWAIGNMKRQADEKSKKEKEV